jgi:hypothetical protein
MLMAGKADFTEQEWETLRKGVTGAGLLVSVSDRSFLDSFREAGALAKHLSGARRDTTSEVVRELAETRGTGFGLTASPAEVESETLDALRSSVAMLQAKAPEDLDAYRSFVLQVAESVARAAGGGEAAESGVLDRVRSALGAA